MSKPVLLAALLILSLSVQGQAQTAPPPPPGPFPQDGVFCGPFRLCDPGLVTRAEQ